MNIFKKEQVEHDWEYQLTSYDRDNHKEYKLYQCKACHEFKKEYTGKVYENYEKNN